MNIVFLHLSDLHLQDKSGAHSSRIQALAQSLNEFSPFDGIVIKKRERFPNPNVKATDLTKKVIHID